MQNDDPSIRLLLPAFLDRWAHQLADGWWAEIRCARNGDELRRLGHTVTGSFAQYGLQTCAELGPPLNACGHAGDWERADALVEELRARVRKLRAELPAG